MEKSQSFAQYRGVHTSLYANLDATSIGNLERAIFLTEIGRYAQAREIFETAFSATRDAAVVIIEEAELGMQQLRYGDVYRTLDRGLGAARQSPDYDDDAPSIRFMKLFQAMVAIYHRGTVTPAIEQIHRTQHWLKDVSVSEYTDIQVDVIRKYVLTVLLVSMQCHFDEPETSLIPQPTALRIPWQGLTDLRCSLLDRNLLNEVLPLFRVERSRLPISERADAIQSALKRIESVRFQSEEQRLWMQADLKLLLANSFNEQKNVESAEIELNEVENLLQRWGQMTSVEQVDTVSTYLSMRFFRIEMLPEEEPVARLNQCLAMLDALQSTGHLRLVTCFHRATEAADAVALLTGSKGYRDLYYRLHEARQTHQETVLEDIVAVLADYADVVHTALKSSVDIRKALEWLNGFEEKYPYFESPSGLLEINRHRYRLYERLGDKERSAEAQVRIEALNDLSPRRIGPMVGVRSTQKMAPKTSTASANSDGFVPQSMADDDIEETNFFMEWLDVAANPEKKIIKTMGMISKWLSEDFSRKIISEQDLHDIARLLLHDDLVQGDNISMDTNSIFRNLESLHPMSAYRNLFTPEKKSLDFESWSRVLQMCKSWLEKPSISSFNGRQYVYFSLQNMRKDLIYTGEHPVKLKISEIERCLEVFPTLPKAVQEFIGTQPSLWHSAIASACIVSMYTPDRFANIEAFKSENAAWLLDKAELESQIALGMIEKVGHVYALVMVQRTLAEVYLAKMHYLLLQPAADANTDQKLQELMEKGLAELDKIQIHHDQCQLDATMPDKLESHKSREQELALSLSPRVMPLALHLLLTANLLSPQPVQPNEEVVERMWHWVQRSKARSLARTMGLRNVAPSGILKDIQASEECNHLYLEMLELQKAISESTPHQRYNLRRQLESHMDVMKQNMVLKQLLNIQLGEPLSYDDIEKISAVSDTSIVFVDWIFLPGYMTRGEILLFTARAGCVPTVDLLSVKMEVVEQWVKDYLDCEEPDDFGFLPLETSHRRAETTARLNNLIEPLNRRTQPGELLIFSPSASLYRVPLHALEVSGADESRKEPIIRRNPIVYSHSQSLLRSCFWASQLAAEEEAPLHPLFIHAIPGGPDEGKSSVEEIAEMQFAAKNIEARILTEESATKAAFVSAAPGSRLIHIHTHGWWQSDDPLSHNLDFFHAVPDLEAAVPDEAGRSLGLKEAEYKLTAQEVFSIPLARGSHVSLIACRGGLARINQGDEVMGMVPALLASGASSTISTLWPILDFDGAQFARSFYAHLFEETRQASPAGPGAPGLLNLAKAFQRAVCDMEFDSREPLLSWAGFVFHGYWSFHLPLD